MLLSTYIQLVLEALLLESVSALHAWHCIFSNFTSIPDNQPFQPSIPISANRRVSVTSLGASPPRERFLYRNVGVLSDTKIHLLPLSSIAYSDSRGHCGERDHRNIWLVYQITPAPGPRARPRWRSFGDKLNVPFHNGCGSSGSRPCMLLTSQSALLAGRFVVHC